MGFLDTLYQKFDLNDVTAKVNYLKLLEGEQDKVVDPEVKAMNDKTLTGMKEQEKGQGIVDEALEGQRQEALGQSIVKQSGATPAEVIKKSKPSGHGPNELEQAATDAGTLGNVGKTILDTAAIPGSYVRGAVVGKPGETATGSDVMQKFDPNTDGFLKSLGTFGVDMLTDPINLIGTGAYKGAAVGAGALLGSVLYTGKGLKLSKMVSPTGKSFAEQKFKFELPVKVTQSDGSAHYDVVKGLNKGHALARAKENWQGAAVEESTDAAANVKAAAEFEEFERTGAVPNIPESSLKTSRGFTFISPNASDTSLTPEAALAASKSPEHATTAEEVGRMFSDVGIKSKVYPNAQGVWDGVHEQTIVLDHANLGNLDEVRYPAAQGGKKLRQKDVLNFKEDAAGKDRIYLVELKGEVNSEELQKALASAKIPGHTVIQDGDVTRVIVYDEGAQLEGQVQQLAKEQGVPVAVIPGTGETIVAKHLGKWADTREEAAAGYDDIIQKWEAQTGGAGAGKAGLAGADDLPTGQEVTPPVEVDTAVRAEAAQLGVAPEVFDYALNVASKLKPGKVADIGKALTQAAVDHPEILKGIPTPPPGLDESGKAAFAVTWLLARAGIGGVVGAYVGETADEKARNALIGVGLGAIMSPSLVSALATVIRQNAPSKYVTKLAAGANTGVLKPAGAITVGDTSVQINLKAAGTDPAKLKALVDDLSVVYKEKMDSGSLPIGSRGVIPNAVAKRLGQELGLTEAEVVARVAGSAHPVEQVFAYADVVEQAKDYVTALHGQAKSGNPEALTDLVKALDQYVIVSSQLDGVLEESGRALQAARYIPSREHAEEVQQGYELLVKAGNITPEAIVAMLDTAGVQNVVKVGKMVANDPRWADMTSELIYGFALSNPATPGVNVVSALVINPMITLTQRAMAEARGGATVSGETVAAMFGYLQGAKRMIQAVKDTYASEGGVLAAMRKMNQTLPGGGFKQDIRRTGNITGQNMSDLLSRAPVTAWAQYDPNGWIGKLTDMAGSTIRVSSEFMELGDKFGYAVNFDMAAHAKAWNMGFKEGLRDDALWQFVGKELEKPSWAVKQEADAFAKHELFKAPMGGEGGLEGAASGVATALKNPAMRPFVTFVGAPFNIARYSLEGVPYLNLALKSVRDDIAAGGHRKQMIEAKMALTSSLMATAAVGVQAGYITGRGPEDPKQRAAWLKNHEEYSVKLFGRWWSYKWADPLASWVGSVADAATILERDDDGHDGMDVVGAILLGGMRNFSNKTYAKDTFDFFNAVTAHSGSTAESGSEAAVRYFEQRAKIAVPAIVGGVTSVTDPVKRETDSLITAWMARVPGLSHTLPKQYDLFGDVKESAWARGGSFNRFGGRDATPDPVAEELDRVHARIGEVPRVFDGQDLTAEERSELALTRGKKVLHDGRNFKQDLKHTIQSPRYQNPDTTDFARKVMLQDVTEGFNKAAFGYMAQKGNDKFKQYHMKLERAEKMTGETFSINPY